MTKKEAAEYLGVSEKSVTTYVKNGKLTVRYEPGKTSPIAKFDPTEVAAFKASRNVELPIMEAGNPEAEKQEDGIKKAGNQEVRSKKSLAVPTSNFPLPSSGPIIQIEAAYLPELAQALYKSITTEVREVPIESKPLLTFPEAAAYSGIAEGRLREAAKSGEIPTAKNLGRAQKMRRTDLDNWIDKQFE